MNNRLYKYLYIWKRHCFVVGPSVECSTWVFYILLDRKDSVYAYCAIQKPCPTWVRLQGAPQALPHITCRSVACLCTHTSATAVPDSPHYWPIFWSLVFTKVGYPLSMSKWWAVSCLSREVCTHVFHRHRNGPPRRRPVMKYSMQIFILERKVGHAAWLLFLSVR